MNFFAIFKKKFFKKNIYAAERSEYKDNESELNEFRKKEILRTLQAPKSLKDFEREMIAETFQGENYLMQQMFINSRISQQENNTNEISQQITRSKNNDI